MKIIIALLAGMMIGFTSCTKTSSPTGSNTFLKATINGVPFNGTTCVWRYNNTYGDLSINGGSNYHNDTGFFPPYILLGIDNYSLDTGTFFSCIAGIDSGALYAATHSATIIITAKFPYIVGTFSFIGNDSTMVTNGSFKCKEVK